MVHLKMEGKPETPPISKIAWGWVIYHMLVERGEWLFKNRQPSVSIFLNN